MGHATQASLFRQRLEHTLDMVSAKMERKAVTFLPDTIKGHMDRNRQKLRICCSDLTEKDQADLLAFFNDDWGQAHCDGQITHWCPPGCCADDHAARQKMRSLLDVSFAKLFPVPLLYRWKHFEGALSYTLRNTCMHDLLPFVWSAGMTDANDASLMQDKILELDSPDLPPALKQQVRMGKVLRLLHQPDILAPCLLLVTGLCVEPPGIVLH